MHNAGRGKSDYRHEGKKLGSHKIFFFPAGITFGIAGPEETKNLAGKCPPPDSDPFSDAKFGKILAAGQDNSTARSNR